jgi:hypothetical protein
MTILENTNGDTHLYSQPLSVIINHDTAERSAPGGDRNHKIKNKENKWHLFSFDICQWQMSNVKVKQMQK